MNKLILICGAVLGGGAAMAADLPSRAPPAAVYPAPAPPPLWTGPFLGASIGGVFGGAGNNISGKNLICVSYACEHVSSQASSVGGGRSSRASLAAGGQVGYNFQLDPGFVVGGVLDLTAFNRSGSTSFSETSDILFNQQSIVNVSPFTETRTYSGSFKQSWLATARLRAGMAFNNLWLYGTGGVAFGDLKSNSATTTTWRYSNDAPYGVAASGTGSTSGTAFGWTAGVGGEYKLGSNWSLVAEYLYYSLHKSYAVAVSPNPAVAGPGDAYVYNVKAKGDGHIIKVGLNYAFWSYADGPVFARY